MSSGHWGREFQGPYCPKQSLRSEGGLRMTSTAQEELSKAEALKQKPSGLGWGQNRVHVSEWIR